MKTGILKVIIRGAFGLACLVSLSAQAQMPGAGGPAGMSAALTKLFGPSGYTQYTNPQEMMQGMMKKMMQNSQPK